MSDLEKIQKYVDDRWEFVGEKKNADFIKLILNTVARLQVQYDVNLETDLGFGYTLEETIKHIQDDTKEGKNIMAAYKSLVGDYKRKKMGLN